MWWVHVPDKVLGRRKGVPLAPSSLSCCLRRGCGSEPSRTIELRDNETTANAQDSYLREIKCLFNLSSFYFGSFLHLAINATYPNKFRTKVVETVWWKLVSRTQKLQAPGGPAVLFMAGICLVETFLPSPGSQITY